MVGHDDIHGATTKRSQLASSREFMVGISSEDFDTSNDETEDGWAEKKFEV